MLRCLVLYSISRRIHPPPRCRVKRKEKMKTNRPINECHCYNCRKYEECRAKGVFDDDPGFDFCVNYEDVSYPDDDNDEND